MVTIQSGSIEVEDGDTISVGGTELTFRDTGEIELPSGETLISLSDINGNDISPASVTADALEAVESLNGADLTTAQEGETLLVDSNPPNFRIGSAGEIETLDVETPSDLPAFNDIEGPAIAYIRDVDGNGSDDYAAIFQEGI
jgi:hypothetical protein